MDNKIIDNNKKDDIKRNMRIYQILKKYGQCGDCNFFESLIKTKFDFGENQNINTNQKKSKCINCQKEVDINQIYNLEDLGIHYCIFCQDTIE